MSKVSIKIENDSLQVFYVQSKQPKYAVVFAAGSGGNPERHEPLLNILLECGCSVIAPYFERIMSPIPTEDELQKRIVAIDAAFSLAGTLNVPIVGVGHSIGASLLLGFAGGQMWTKSGKQLKIKLQERLNKLILFTPPIGFFQAPNSLAKVNASIQLWAGSVDNITPPEQVEILSKALKPITAVDFRLIEGAGHFSFMNVLPPNVVDSMNNRDDFLRSLSAEVGRYATI